MQKQKEGKIKINDDTKKNIIRIVFFIILSFCYLIFFFNTQRQPIIKADIDGQFNFSRVMSLENIWKSPVNFKYFQHNASAVNLMYPWATVYPMYLFIKLTGSLVGGYYIYFFLITFATLEITYQCVKKMGQSSLPSIFTSVVYAFAICRTSDIYYRVDMGEAISMTFFPIVLLGIYQIFYKEKPNWKTLVIGLTFLVYTQILSLAIALLLILFFVCVSLIRKQFTKKRFKALLKSFGMTILLGLGFLIPMVQTMINGKVNGPKSMNLYSHSLIPRQLLDLSLSNTAGSRAVFNPVFLILFLVIVLNLKQIKGFFRDVLFAAAFFTFISTSLFPWDIFQKMFGSFQFPWHFITMASLLFPVVASELINSYQQNHSISKSIKVIGLLILGIVFTHWGTMMAVNQIDGYHVGSNSHYYLSRITQKKNFNGLSDYRPAISNGDAGYITDQKMCVNQEWVHVKQKMINTATRTFKYNSKTETTAILPVYVFPGEKVTVNGIKQATQIASADGATQVSLVDGVNNIKIKYGYTFLARVSWLVSLIAFFIFCWGIFQQNRGKYRSGVSNYEYKKEN